MSSAKKDSCFFEIQVDTDFSDEISCEGNPTYETPDDCTASSFLPDLDKDYSCSSAIDGDNIDLGWSSDGSPLPQWIQFDLGEQKCIGGVRLNPMVPSCTLNISTSIGTTDLETQITSWLVSQTPDDFSSNSFTEKAGRYITVITTDSDSPPYAALSEFEALTRPLSTTASYYQSLQLTVNIE